MKKIFTMCIVFLLALSVVLPSFAANGKVTYDGNSQKFIFEPGSNHSPSDLFPDFKSVMPGDRLTQKITVKNDASENVKVKIYIRSLGAQEGSETFLSQLALQVKKSEDNDMAYMFDASADESAQLTDWVYLGMLYSGGEVNLDVLLQVPVQLGNEFQNQVGYLDWEFKVEEFPVEPDDPKPPQTGNNPQTGLWITVAGSSATVLLLLFLWRRKNKESMNK